MRAGDTSQVATNPQVLQGKKLDVIASAHQAQLTQAWIGHEGLSTLARWCGGWEGIAPRLGRGRRGGEDMRNVQENEA